MDEEITCFQQRIYGLIIKYTLKFNTRRQTNRKIYKKKNTIGISRKQERDIQPN